jgi:peptidoglycan/LPS O-acetylase OafA/YrhL
MLIHLVKFIHLLCVLGLLGSTLFCLVLVSSRPFTTNSKNSLVQFNRVLLWLAALALLTGTLLVHPKHYTFHTPWIQAAYVLLFIFGALVSLLQALKKKKGMRFVWWSTYFLLTLLLLVIIHDAVAKTIIQLAN